MKKIYNLTTHELFGVISFLDPLSLFKNINIDTKIKVIRYCYVFPQRNYTWATDNNLKGITIYYKQKTTYWWLCFKLDIERRRMSNFKKLPF